jgi:hypothetical protein
MFKKIFSHNNNRQIWRLLISETDKLIIEERDKSTKEAFFNVIDIKTGKYVIKDLQLEEKSWLGIESVYNDLIFFHAYEKPDMPGHKGIFVFDISKQKIIWQTNEYNFYFIYKDCVYCFKELFEGRYFYSLSCKEGKLVNEFGQNIASINSYKQESEKIYLNQGYLFPQSIERFEDKRMQNAVCELTKKYIPISRFEYLIYNQLLLISFHTQDNLGLFTNNFFIVDINNKKTIFADMIGERLSSLQFDSFFMKNNCLFLLNGKIGVNGFIFKN